MIGASLQARSSSVEKAAAAKGAQVFHSDFFGPTDSLPGVNFAPEFMQAVFSAQEKAPPQSVGTQLGYVVFQITGVRPPATPTFDEIRAQLMQSLDAFFEFYPEL